ncbi:DUF4129 domain-containing protein [Flindersiella endophytica]
MRAWERRLEQLKQNPLLLVGIVVALLAVGAVGVGLREQVELGKQSYRPDLTPTVLVVLAACTIVFGFLLWAMPKRRPTGPPRKRTNPLMQALGMLIVAGLFALAAQCAPKGRNAQLPMVKPPGTVPTPPAETGSGSVSPGVASGIPLAILAGLAIAALAGLLWYRTRDNLPPVDERSEAEDLRVVIAAGQAAMAGQVDARSAVIAAYAAMENALTRAGVQRRVADTPTEVLSKAGAAGLFGPAAAAAAAELTELFERARFSDRPMPLGAREYAERALAELDADLEAAIARAAAARQDESAGVR